MRLVGQAGGLVALREGAVIWPQHIGLSPPDLAQQEQNGWRNVMQFRSTQLTNSVEGKKLIAMFVLFVWSFLSLSKSSYIYIILHCVCIHKEIVFNNSYDS